MVRTFYYLLAMNPRAKTANRRIFVRRLLRWGRANRREFPWRVEADPFRVLVAELMLQRSRGGTVARVYDALFQRWSTPTSLSEAEEAEIAQVIRPIGLTSRAKTIKRLAASIVELDGVPRTVEGLMELPGIGRYAASATAAVAFQKSVGTVDGVSARVYRRYFGLPSDLPAVGDQTLWDLVTEVTPSSAVREWNWAVLDHASSICLPKVPRCLECPLSDACTYFQVANNVPPDS